MNNVIYLRNASIITDPEHVKLYPRLTVSPPHDPSVLNHFIFKR